MTPTERALRLSGRIPWAGYLELCKPRVVALIVFTAVVGMLLAPLADAEPARMLAATLGIALGAASGAVINHLADRRFDRMMARTRARPLAAGRIEPRAAARLAALLGLTSMALLGALVNPLTALLTLASMVGYSVVYTLFLKHATPQNIVIGGAAGAMPPVLGWSAMTGAVDPDALLLFLIIFTWTPPHFWALAIHRREDYRRAAIPMLPVTHGEAFTRLQILLYTVLLSAISVLPFLTGMSGLIYLLAALALDARFLWLAWRLLREGDGQGRLAIRTFLYSIGYLAALFAALLVDRYL